MECTIRNVMLVFSKLRFISYTKYSSLATSGWQLKALKRSVIALVKES